MIVLLLFLLFVFLVLYSYFVYPSTLLLFSSKRIQGSFSEPRNAVFILAAYNEEKYIEETIRAIFRSVYSEKIERVYVGDDDSSDHTRAILSDLKKEFPRLEVETFHRIGKPSIVKNIIEKNALNDPRWNLFFIDANISLESSCFSILTEELRQDELGLVGASVFPLNHEINFESEYILKENKIKAEESRTINYVVGIFGACYAMKGELYKPIPDNFITDDLYYTFSVISQGKKVAYSQHAHVYENIFADVENEFRRKRRYAAGNFQILLYFWKILIPWYSSWGFIYSYFFHKIIRWVSPVIIFIFWILSFFGQLMALSQSISILGTMICLFLFSNYVFQKNGMPVYGKRIYYFFMMNLAIFFGFFNYLNGVKSNVWERSERV